MEFPSFNHHHHHRYVPPPPPPNNFSDDRPNLYPHHHLLPPVQLPPPPPQYPTLHPPLPQPPLPVLPPPSYNPHQSHFTFLDAQKPSFINHNRSSDTQPRVSNQCHRFNYRTDMISPDDHHRRLNSQSEFCFKPNGSERAISNIRFRDNRDASFTDGYAAGRDISNIVSQDRYSSIQDFVEKYEPHYTTKSENDGTWDSHGEEDPKWVMRGKKNSFQSRDYEYESSGKSNRVRDGREEFKQVQKQSVLLRIGKPNKTSRNRNHDQHFSKTNLVESNNSNAKGKDKDRNRDHTGKDSNLYMDKRVDGDREHSPVDLDVSFKSNTLVAKAVVTPLSPMSDTNCTQPRNRKIKRVTEFDSPLSKFSDRSTRSGSSSHGLDTSSSEKASQQVRDKSFVNDVVEGSSSGGPDVDEGGGNGRLSFRLKKKRKLMTFGSLASSFQLAVIDDKSGKVESAKKSPIARTPVEESISSKVDESLIAIVSEKDGSEIENTSLEPVESFSTDSAEYKKLTAQMVSIINDDPVNDFNQQSSVNEISPTVENDAEKLSADVRQSIHVADISDLSVQDQIEIQKCPQELYPSFDAANIPSSLCNESDKLQEMRTFANMNSLDSCSDEIIIVSPENGDDGGFLDDLSRKEEESQLLEDISRQTCFDGLSKFPEDGPKESSNAVVVTAEDNATPIRSHKESSFDKDEVAETTSVQTLRTDHRASSTDETYRLPKDDLPTSSSSIIFASANDTGAFVTDLNDKSVESMSDMLTSIASTEKVSSFSGSQMLTSNSTDKTASILGIPNNAGYICEHSVSKDGPLLNGPESSLEDSKTSIRMSHLDVTSLLANTKNLPSASHGGSVKTLDSSTKLRGANLSMKKPSPVSAFPRVFAGRPTTVITNSRINNLGKNIAKPRTWHRSTSNPDPPPPKPIVTGHNSYIRSGNTLVRKAAHVTAAPSVSAASRSSVYQFNLASPIEINDSAGSGIKVNSTNPKTGGPTVPVLRPKTPPLSGSTKLPDCPTYSKDFTSSPLEDQNGTSSNSESQKTLDEGVAGKKIQYVKRKSNQLVAASSSDQSIQDLDKTQALSSDGYYMRKKNQLIRTSVGDDSANTDMPKALKINIKRQSGISKKYKHLRFPSVWTLSSQSSGKDGVPLHEKLRPHLFPWKRSRNWGNVMSMSASIPSNSSSTSISRKLLLSRKRDMIYTRSKHGFSLRMSKLLSVGGSSLKWSKSIERNSKRANEEATLAVVAAEKKKREQHGTAEIKSRNNMSSKSIHNKKQHPGDRIFRIGLVRYKMDPSRRTLQRISDEEPSTSMQSKEEIRKSYVPKRLKIGHDEYVRIGNGNQLVRNPKRRTRIFANEKVRWSLHTARSRLAKKKKYCQFFTRFGKCNKDDGKCPYIHDPSKIAVCTKFLRGSCSNPNCMLTHKVIPERMQDCSYFLQGLCSNIHCPYRHVNVNSAASICEGFLKGYCAVDNECRKKHTYACPVFEATGSCSKGTKCKLHHPKNRNMWLKRKQHSMEQQKNSRGRYFGSIRGAEAMTISENYHSKDDDVDILCQEGKFAEYISLDFSNEEAGEVTSDQRTLLVHEQSSLGAGDFDELTKPIRIMNRIVFESPSRYDLGVS